MLFFGENDCKHLQFMYLPTVSVSGSVSVSVSVSVSEINHTFPTLRKRQSDLTDDAKIRKMIAC